MRIGELSSLSGASARSLRYYEHQGVLSSQRQLNGYREYGPEAAARVDMIRALLDAGLPMDVIRDVLSCTAALTDPPQACGAVFTRMRTVRDRLDEQAARLRTQVAALDGYLGQADADRPAPPAPATEGHPRRTARPHLSPRRNLPSPSTA